MKILTTVIKKDSYYMYHDKMKTLIYYMEKHHIQMDLKYTSKQYKNAGI